MKVAVNSLNASLATYFVLFFKPQLLYKACCIKLVTSIMVSQSVVGSRLQNKYTDLSDSLEGLVIDENGS